MVFMNEQRIVSLFKYRDNVLVVMCDAISFEQKWYAKAN